MTGSELKKNRLASLAIQNTKYTKGVAYATKYTVTYGDKYKYKGAAQRPIHTQIQARAASYPRKQKKNKKGEK